MGYVLINESILSSIGNILRSKLNVSSTFTPIEFINGINNIETLWRNVLEGNIVDYSDSSIISINNSIFRYNPNINTISLPNVEYIGNNAFNICINLSSINIHNCSYIGDYAFAYCSNLSYISIPNCSYIGSYAFNGCSKLESIYVLSTSVPRLYNANAFYSTPISDSGYLGYFGSIYVLSSLVDSFKTATNWSYYSSRITAYTGT